MWFIGVEVEQHTSAPPPEKNPGSAAESSVKEIKEHAKYESMQCSESAGPAGAT